MLTEIKHMRCERCEKDAISFLVQEAPARRVLFGLLGVYNRSKSWNLCMDHLLEDFTTSFNRVPWKMLVFPPVIKDNSLPYAYEFEPLDKLEGINTFRSTEKKPGEFKHFVESILSRIIGKCDRCSMPAEVACFSEDSINWERGSPQIIIEKSVPTIRCKKCAIEILTPLFKENISKFTEGFYLPFDGNGVFSPKDY